MIPIIREATIADIGAHVADLSNEDIMEQLVLRRNAVASLVYELGRPGKAYAWIVNDKPVMLFGVNSDSVLSGTGWIWISVTKEAKRYTATMLRQWKPLLAEMEAGYSRIETTIHASLVTTLKWIKRAGYTVMDATPYHGGDEMFHFCFKECA